MNKDQIVALTNVYIIFDVALVTDGMGSFTVSSNVLEYIVRSSKMMLLLLYNIKSVLLNKFRRNKILMKAN